MESKLLARLAQSVERWPFKPVVVGSSPTGGDPLCARQRNRPFLAISGSSDGAVSPPSPFATLLSDLPPRYSFAFAFPLSFLHQVRSALHSNTETTSCTNVRHNGALAYELAKPPMPKLVGQIRQDVVANPCHLIECNNQIFSL